MENKTENLTGSLTESEPNLDRAEALINEVSEAIDDQEGKAGAVEPIDAVEPIEAAKGLIRRVLWFISQLLQFKHPDLALPEGAVTEAEEKVAPVLVKYGLLVGGSGRGYGEEFDAVVCLGKIFGQTYFEAKGLSEDSEEEKGCSVAVDSSRDAEDDEHGWLGK